MEEQIPHKILYSARKNLQAQESGRLMAHRLQRLMKYLIDVTQSAFLRGRDISDNIRHHLGLAAGLKELGLPGWLLAGDGS